MFNKLGGKSCYAHQMLSSLISVFLRMFLWNIKGSGLAFRVSEPFQLIGLFAFIFFP